MVWQGGAIDVSAAEAAAGALAEAAAGSVLEANGEELVVARLRGLPWSFNAVEVRRRTLTQIMAASGRWPGLADGFGLQGEMPRGCSVRACPRQGGESRRFSVAGSLGGVAPPTGGRGGDEPRPHARDRD